MILTIGITSYNRVNELKRALESIETKYTNDIEILVSEDHSPMSKEIENTVKKFSENSIYETIFYSNEKNLGYDRNLANIISKAKGDFIFYLSDDDKIYPTALDTIIDILKNNKHNIGVLYSSFMYEGSTRYDRLHENDMYINASEENAAKYIYDSILFSGLVFKKQLVEDLDANRFLNYNYFQVYMFLLMILKYGGYYIQSPSVVCIGDGENAYGSSESSGNNELLKNRKKVISNLEFNKTLFLTIKQFDNDFNTHIFDNFSKQYSIHSYSGLSIARQEGMEAFQEYWKKLNTLDIKLNIIPKIYYICLLILGKKNSDFFFNKFRKIIKRESL